MEWLLGGFLGFLELLEFLTTSQGLAAIFWILLHFSLQLLGLEFWMSALVSAIPAIDLYILLMRLDV